MCPLRLILIFVSAALAGFFVIRNLKSQQPLTVSFSDDDDHQQTHDYNNRFSKLRLAIQSGFWTFVDMATGRYLWRHFAASAASPSSKITPN